MNSKIDEVSDFLLDYATTLMGSGSHTARIIRSVCRIAEAKGYEANLSIFQKTITMMIKDPRTGESLTGIRRIRPMALNFRIVSELSSLSWEAYDKSLHLADLKRKFDKIVAAPRMSRWIVLFLVACANASFCMLFGGDLIAIGLVFAGTLLAFYVRQEMMNVHANHFLVFLVASVISSMVTALGIIYNLGETPQIALATSVLFLIPGVPLINAIMDILEGFVLVGLSRFMNAIMLIICLSVGLFITLSVLGINNL